MGFHIGLATKKDGRLVELPHAPWPEPGWDHARLGWDHEYFSALFTGEDGRGAEVFRCDNDDVYGCDELVSRPSDEKLHRLRAAYPDNKRCQRLVELLLADPEMVVFFT